jgi:small-conductance mechanosensitive channel
VIVQVHLPRGEDLEEIRRLLASLCAEIRADEKLAIRLFSGPEVLGVHQPSEDTVLLRVGAETTPARAESVKRELSMRIERRFVPVPHRVEVG